MDWAFYHLDEAQAETRSILEQRLLKFMDARIKLRAQDDLDRVFYRTLSEPRRQQAWRRSMSEIAINTSPKRGEEAAAGDDSKVS